MTCLMLVHRPVSFFSLVSQVFLAALLGMSAQARTLVAGTTAGQFSVSESGVATYRIPIQVPPGVAGMEPKLEFLCYRSFMVHCMSLITFIGQNGRVASCLGVLH